MAPQSKTRGLLMINLPIILCTIIAEIILFAKGEKIMWDYTAILVAIIGVLGTYIAIHFQLKKITNTMPEVKADASHMSSQIDNINETTKDINVYLTRTIDKKIAELMRQNNDISVDGRRMSEAIQFMAEELRYKKRLDSEYLGRVSKKMIQSGIETLYEENVRLTVKLKEYEEKYNMLQRENILLKERNDVLKKENDKLIEKEKKHDKGLEI